MKIRNLTRYRLRMQLIGVNLAIALMAIFIIGGGSFSLYYQQTMRYVHGTTNIYFSEVSERLTSYYQKLNKIAEAVYYTEIFQRIVISAEKDLIEQENYDQLMKNYTGIEDSIKDILFINTYDGSDYFLIDPGQIYKIRSTILQKYKETNATHYKLHLMRNNREDSLNTNLYATQKIKSYLTQKRTYLQDIGYGVLVLENNTVKKILSNNDLPTQTQSYLVDKDDVIIASTDNVEGTFYDATLVDPVKYIIISQKLKDVNQDLRVICHIPKSHLYKNIEQYSKYIIVTIIIILIITIIGSVSYNYKLTRPLKELADTFDRVAKGNLKSRLNFEDKNEITIIEQHFNHMMREIYALNSNIVKNQGRLYEAELDKKQFQYKSLQNQIKSHFLYNTLTMIRGMAQVGRKEEMSILIGKLVAYLRYTAREEQFVTIGEEIRHLENYACIQDMRFDKNIKIKADIPKELREAHILKLILQPLVENAAKHGFNQWNKKGIILIKARIKGTDIEVKVIDNGIGLSKESLEEVMGLLKTTTKEIHHIGMQNIQRRMCLEYGDKYGLHIKSWEGIGTIIKMKFPYKRDNE